MRFWRRSSSDVEEPGLREKLAEQEGALEAEQRNNAKHLSELRNTMQGKVDEVVAINKKLSSSMLRRVAPEMSQKDLAAYVPNGVALRYGLGIMAQTDKDFGRAPIAAISGDDVAYRSDNFDRRCSLSGDELCNVVRSAVMSDDFDVKKEYMVSRDGCELYVSALSSVDSDSYLVRMVPLGAGRKMFAKLGKSALGHAKKTMKRVITPDVGGDYATE